jgi:hypothetical protein
MMNKLKLKTLVPIITLSLAASFSAKASLSSEIDGLLGSLSVSSTGTNVQDLMNAGVRPGVSLGALRVRVPHNAITVATFTPPSVNYSCGSLDLVGGSFSFFSLDDLIATIRNIASGTLTYALGQSIHALCPPCWAQLKEWQEDIAKLNQYMGDTCTISQSHAKDFDEYFDKARCGVVAHFGGDDDEWDCKMKNEDNSTEKALEAYQVAGKLTHGNYVYEVGKKILPTTSSVFKYKDSIFGESLDDVEVVLNLIDHQITKGTENDETASYHKKITIKQLTERLLSGESIKAGTWQYRTCGSETETASFSGVSKTYRCLNYIESNTNSTEFESLDTYFQKRLVDDGDESTDTSLLEILVKSNKTGTNIPIPTDIVFALEAVNPHLARALLIAANPSISESKAQFGRIAHYLAYSIASSWYTELRVTLSKLQEQMKENNVQEIAQKSISAVIEDIDTQKATFEKEIRTLSYSIYSDPTYKAYEEKYNFNKELINSSVTSGTK